SVLDTLQLLAAGEAAEPARQPVDLGRELGDPLVQVLAVLSSGLFFDATAEIVDARDHRSQLVEERLRRRPLLERAQALAELVAGDRDGGVQGTGGERGELRVQACMCLVP